MNPDLLLWLKNTETKLASDLIDLVKDENEIYGVDTPEMLLVNTYEIIEWLLLSIDSREGSEEDSEKRIVYEDRLMIALLEVYEYENTRVDSEISQTQTEVEGAIVGAKLGECPICKSNNIEYGDSEIDGDTIWYDCECVDCDTYYTEYHDIVLSSIEVETDSSSLTFIPTKEKIC